ARSGRAVSQGSQCAPAPRPADQRTSRARHSPWPARNRRWPRYTSHSPHARQPDRIPAFPLDSRPRESCPDPAGWAVLPRTGCAGSGDPRGAFLRLTPDIPSCPVRTGPCRRTCAHAGRTDSQQSIRYGAPFADIRLLWRHPSWDLLAVITVLSTEHSGEPGALTISALCSSAGNAARGWEGTKNQLAKAVAGRGAASTGACGKAGLSAAW